jgi:hypothetical protein
VVTIDTAAGPASGRIDRRWFNGPVDVVVNFYQTTRDDNVGSHGGPVEHCSGGDCPAAAGGLPDLYNFDVTESDVNHGNIDGVVGPRIVDMIVDFATSGADAREWAGEYFE